MTKRGGNLLVTLFIAACLLYAGYPASASGSPCEERGPNPRVFTRQEISWKQDSIKALPTGKRIAFWAEAFIGTPYDTDPLGAYVRSEKVVCDSEIDCMYLVFRAVELAMSGTPEGAEEKALDLRFKTRGKVENGRVVNYEDRFDYAEDMIYSGKWGQDITEDLGCTDLVSGSRGHGPVVYLPKSALLKPESYNMLKDGDLVFFIKDPVKRAVGEIVGHLGIIKVESDRPVLIHGSGTKANGNKPGGGVVKKSDLSEYLKNARFIGVVVTRFQ